MNSELPIESPTYIGLGSNLDGPMRQIELAFELLDSIDETQLVARSSLYQSAPFGPVEQPSFVNAVARLDTRLDAWALFRKLQFIEDAQGRKRDIHWGPRVLDLDILVYSDLKMDEPELTLPHPGIAERNFVLLPLREIAPELVIPGLGRVADIAIDEHEPQISLIQE
jgi:2-amino-4-hydroxy-6-hydroxymethyldihydropteridine diphosphokinase